MTATTATLERTALEARREELHTRLASAQSRLRDAKFKASMDDAFIPEMNEAEELVRQLEQQIDGLTDGERKVAEHEAAEAEAERMARRRADAVECLRLLAERDTAATKALELLTSVSDALADVTTANSAIASLVRKHSGAPDRADPLSAVILVKLAPAASFELLDKLQARLGAVIRADSDVGAIGGSNPAFRARALDVIAGAMPEVRDATVQAESGAAIDPTFLPN